MDQNRPGCFLYQESAQVKKELHNINEQPHPDTVLAKGGIWIAKEAVSVFHTNAENFFLDHNKNGFTYKRDFLSLLYSMSRGELQSIKTMFELMSNEVYIDVSNAQKIDAQSRPIVRCIYEVDSILHVLLIPIVGDMHRLLWQYSFSIMTCKVSLEELYHLATATTNY